MKRPLVLLGFTLLIAATAEAQSCAKCYWPPDGWGAPPQCGITTYNGAETCDIIDGYICRTVGTCEGSGPECTSHRCPSEKWADGSRLSERARWTVATVEIRRPERHRANS